jgi:hypothetical protein
MTAKKSKATGAKKAQTGKAKPKLGVFDETARAASAKKLARLEALDAPGTSRGESPRGRSRSSRGRGGRGPK